MVSLSVLHGSWPHRSHSYFLVLINQRGKWREWGGEERGGERRGGGDKMASSKSGAGYGFAAELRRAAPGRAKARRAMQVHAPPSARGAAPAALPSFVLGPWHPLVPAKGEAASLPECASGAPSPLPGLPPTGSVGAPEASQAALACPPARSPPLLRCPCELLVSAAPGPEAADAVLSLRCCES